MTWTDPCDIEVGVLVRVAQRHRMQVADCTALGNRSLLPHRLVGVVHGVRIARTYGPSRAAISCPSYVLQSIPSIVRVDLQGFRSSLCLMSSPCVTGLFDFDASSDFPPEAGVTKLRRQYLYRHIRTMLRRIQQRNVHSGGEWVVAAWTWSSSAQKCAFLYMGTRVWPRFERSSEMWLSHLYVQFTAINKTGASASPCMP